MGDFVYTINNDDPRNITINLGTIQLGQMRHIIINTQHLTSDFNYYYTYKIGGQSFTSDDKNVDLSTINTSDNVVNSNIGRFNVVQTIRKIINLKTHNNHNQATKAFDKLLDYYISSNMTDKLTQGIIKNLIGKETGEG